MVDFFQANQNQVQKLQDTEIEAQTWTAETPEGGKIVVTTTKTKEVHAAAVAED
jgi:hypothetical protein